MKIPHLLVALLGSLLLTACGSKVGESPEPNQDRHVGLDPSKIGTPSGEQSISAPDGTKTQVIPNANPADYGLSVMPTAKLKDNAAYKRTTKKDETVLLSLVVEDTFEATKNFYADQLQTEAQVANSGEAILTGKLKDGRSAVVTVIMQGGKETKVEIQIIKVL